MKKNNIQKSTKHSKKKALRSSISHRTLKPKKTVKAKIAPRGKTTKAKSVKAKTVKVTAIGNNTVNKKTNIRHILEQQKQLTKPDPAILIVINSFVDRLNKELKRNKVSADATLGGSVAKGTFIKDNFDADIFVKFDQSYKGKNISEVLERILSTMNLKVSKVHGSRDYFQIKQEFTYELVPVLKVSSYKEAENVADMSPLHVDYFLKKSKTIRNLRDEVRITKLFMKSARVYGAESYIKGFSGHVVDLLIIKYGTFLGLVKAAAKWKDKLIIDLEKYHIDPKMALNSSKIYGPMILVDPVQRNRNAAAAVSKESFDRFRQKCREFLENPNNDAFALPDFDRIMDSRLGKDNSSEIFIITISPLEGKRDVIGAKVLKIKEHIEEQAKENEFKIIWSDWEFNEQKSRICIAFEEKRLSDFITVTGPPLTMEDAAERFRRAHRHTYTEKGSIYAKETRRFLLVKSFLAVLIEDEYVKEKCRDISVEEVKRN